MRFFLHLLTRPHVVQVVWEKLFNYLVSSALVIIPSAIYDIYAISWSRDIVLSGHQSISQPRPSCVFEQH